MLENIMIFFIMDCKIQVDELQNNIIKSIKREFIMKKLTKEEKHKQCLKEIKATMLVVVVCFLWHVLTAFLLNSKGGTLFHMPLWFVVSVFGTIILAIIGVFWLLKFVFVDFSYDEEECEDEQSSDSTFSSFSRICIIEWGSKFCL